MIIVQSILRAIRNRTCKHCGAVLGKNQDQCPKCGTPQDERKAPKKDKK